MINGMALFPGLNPVNMITRISDYIGSPSKDNWSNFEEMPIFAKIKYKQIEGLDYTELFPDATNYELDLLRNL